MNITESPSARISKGTIQERPSPTKEQYNTGQPKSQVEEKSTPFYIPVKDRKDIGSVAKNKLEWLKTATKGESYVDGRFKYKSRSEVFFSLVKFLIRWGKSKSEIETLLDGVYKTKPYLKKIHKKAIESFESDEFVKNINKFYMVNHPLKSQSLVFKALLSLSFQLNSHTIGFSNSEIRKLTGIKHYNTVKKALCRLESRGLIRVEKKKIIIGTTDATFYTFRDRAFYVPIIETLTEKLNLEYVLGENTIQVLMLITTKSQKFTDIFNQLPLSKRNTIYHLKKLVELGIIFSHKEGKNKYYQLKDNYEMRLYELSSDHAHANHLKIAEHQGRQEEYLREMRLYKQLKEEHGPEEALIKLKEILTNNQA